MRCPHCETKIDEHEANRCLDAWVAEAVFEKRLEYHDERLPVGWDGETKEPVLFTKPYWFDLDDDITYLRITDGFRGMVRSYSTSIAAAWEALDHLAKSDFAVHWIVSEGYNCSVLAADWINSTASSAPLAICRAALKAVGES